MEKTKSQEQIELEEKLKAENLRKLAQQKLESQMNKNANMQFRHRYSHTRAGKTKIG